MSAAIKGTLNTVERSLRSVFVGNIAYDATEEQMKDIFSEVGPVANFRLFCDNDSGKPNGYGFCEYKDPAVAHSAMRNLSGFEFKGRALRVDLAASVKSKEALENMYGSQNDPQLEEADLKTEKAPEEISKAVASLPAEQMFELMKQMKMCIENNPHEARNLLLQNPQLAYALLQAQVIMRIVDPEVALKILNRPTAPPASTSENKSAAETMQVNPAVNESPMLFQTAESNAAMQPMNVAPPDPRQVPMPQPRSSLVIDRPPIMSGPPLLGMSGPYADQDLRVMRDQDLRQLPMLDRDMRPPPMMGADKDMRQIMGDQDMRSLGPIGGPPDNRPFDPRFRGSDMNRVPPGVDKARPVSIDPRTIYESRMNPAPARVEDPRKAAVANPRIPPAAATAPNMGVPAQTVPRQAPITLPGVSLGAPQDQEKAALIMQVLQLSDQQIAMLPPEQRQSILVLKEQIARSHLVQ